MYKGDRQDSVVKEVEAATILRSLGLHALEYRYEDWGGQRVATYLIGNVDCHWVNWGFLFEYNRLTEMVPIFDLNHAFEAEEDSLCLPYITLGRKVSQMDAAREAAKQLRFVPREINFEQFKYGEYVQERLNRLRI